MALVLHLLVPGLLGPWPESNTPGFPLPQTPALNSLLARAKRSAHAVGADFALLRLFGIAEEPGRDPPLAALTLLGDGGEPGSDWWLRADPVYLQADLHTVLLCAARSLSITAAEAAALIAEFNRVFAEEGELHARNPQRWYLRAPETPRLQTHVLAEADGSALEKLLPYGPDARKWRSWLTEIQMLFHQHEVNRRREDNAQAMINSVWFWGGGCLPTAAKAPSDAVYSGDPLARGLAHLSGSVAKETPATADEWIQAAEAETSTLVVLEDVRHSKADHNPFGWSETVARLDQDWFAPIMEQLRKKRLQTVFLYPCNGFRYTLNRSALRRFWCFPKALRNYLS